MSNINTNNIDTNYPVPGINNSTQGFRDNFATIKTNFDTAYTEITELQTSAVFKTALPGTTINNDMANTLISNALVRSFRSTTYNLGSSVTGLVTINVNLGDVQYGVVTANTALQFTNWAPAGTQSNLQLQFQVSNANAVITFPNTVTLVGDHGATTLENYGVDGSGNLTITVPAGVTQLDYVLSTIDCGNTVSITPVNRPRKSAQVVNRTPPSAGNVGDMTGTICADANGLYYSVGNYDGSTQIWRSAVSTVQLNARVGPSGVVVPGTTVGVTGQIVADITNNRIWVCYGGTTWRSAALI